MKLLNHTYRAALLALLPVMGIGVLLSYSIIQYVVYEETDEYLQYEMERILAYHSAHGDLPDQHNVSRILEGEHTATHYFRDTLILEPGDDEMVPFRELHFGLRHEGKDFTLVLRHLLMGKDDILEGTLWIALSIALLTGLSFMAMVHYLSRHLWKPFYSTLATLNSYRLTEPGPEFLVTGIEEFNRLNQTLKMLLQKIHRDYVKNRSFNENASHEWQTHLAIIRANAAELQQDENLDPEAKQRVQHLHSAAVRLQQIQKSLLLLSKINNREYRSTDPIRLDQLLNEQVSIFEEAMAIRSIHLEIHSETCLLPMDNGLAEILLSNLIKNAIKYNVGGGFIRISLLPDSMTIVNSGAHTHPDPKQLLERFATGAGGSTGIGLALVQEICHVYGFMLNYTSDETHEHCITIKFQT